MANLNKWFKPVKNEPDDSPRPKPAQPTPKATQPATSKTTQKAKPKAQEPGNASAKPKATPKAKRKPQKQDKTEAETSAHDEQGRASADASVHDEQAQSQEEINVETLQEALQRWQELYDQDEQQQRATNDNESMEPQQQEIPSAHPSISLSEIQGAYAAASTSPSDHMPTSSVPTGSQPRPAQSQQQSKPQSKFDLDILSQTDATDLLSRCVEAADQAADHGNGNEMSKQQRHSSWVRFKRTFHESSTQPNTEARAEKAPLNLRELLRSDIAFAKRWHEVWITAGSWVKLPGELIIMRLGSHNIDHQVVQFEKRFLQRKKGTGTKEVYLTESQISDVYKDDTVVTAIVAFCKADDDRVQQHPQAPGCAKAMQYLVEVEAAKWEKVEEVLQKGLKSNANIPDAEAGLIVEKNMDDAVEAFGVGRKRPAAELEEAEGSTSQNAMPSVPTMPGAQRPPSPTQTFAVEKQLQGLESQVPDEMKGVLQDFKEFALQQAKATREKEKKLLHRKTKQAEAKKRREVEQKEATEKQATDPVLMAESWLIGIGEVLLKVEKYKNLSVGSPQDPAVWHSKFVQHEKTLIQLRSGLESGRKGQPDLEVLQKQLAAGKAEVHQVSLNIMSLDAIFNVFKQMKEKQKHM